MICVRLRSPWDYLTSGISHLATPTVMEKWCHFPPKLTKSWHKAGISTIVQLIHAHDLTGWLFFSHLRYHPASACSVVMHMGWCDSRWLAIGARHVGPTLLITFPSVHIFVQIISKPLVPCQYFLGLAPFNGNSSTSKRYPYHHPRGHPYQKWKVTPSYFLVHLAIWQL